MKRIESEILILGAGCAGLTAGIYAARAGKRTVILEQGIPGGQAAITARIDNYPGISDIDGVSLMQTMVSQAKKFGAEIRCCQACGIDPTAKIVTTDTQECSYGALILAMGAVPRKLGIPGEIEFQGRGVSYCASCDGFFYRDRQVIVVGGGNSAAEEALHLAELGSSVRMLVRRDSLGCEAHLAERVQMHPKIQICFRKELRQIWGDDQIQGLTIQDGSTGTLTREEIPGCGVFIFAGYQPASAFLKGKLTLDEKGYIVTDDRLQSSLPGVFAAGDIRRKPLRQIVTAAADGAEAAFHACKFCSNMLS